MFEYDRSSLNEIMERQKEQLLREEEFLEDWPNRRASAVMELEKALTAPYYHFVVNDDLTLAVDACMKIAKNRDRFVRKDDETRLLARDLLDTIISEVNRTTRS